jgi:hypothetical protein
MYQLNERHRLLGRSGRQQARSELFKEYRASIFGPEAVTSTRPIRTARLNLPKEPDLGWDLGPGAVNPLHELDGFPTRDVDTAGVAVDCDHSEFSAWDFETYQF